MRRWDFPRTLARKTDIPIRLSQLAQSQERQTVSNAEKALWSAKQDAILVSVGTAGANTTDNVTGVSTGIAFVLATGEYIITCILGVTTAATTTAPRFTFIASGGLVVDSFDMQADISTTAVASQPSNSNALGTFTAATTGQGATRRPVVITTRLRVTTGGTATLQMVTEISTSAVTMVEGSGFAIKVA